MGEERERPKSALAHPACVRKSLNKFGFGPFGEEEYTLIWRHAFIGAYNNRNGPERTGMGFHNWNGQQN